MLPPLNNKQNTQVFESVPSSNERRSFLENANKDLNDISNSQEEMKRNTTISKKLVLQKMKEIDEQSYLIHNM